MLLLVRQCLRTLPFQDQIAVRIRVLAERLPERPGTPGVSPADRERTEDGWVLTREAGKVGISAVVSGGDWDWKVDELDNFEAMP